MIIKCKCGCGKTFEKYDSRGRERRFAVGHNAKVNPPMKGKRHKEETKKKLREARKKQVIIWTEERKKKFSGDGNPFYGKKHTRETKEKIGKANSGRKSYWLGKKRNITPEWREKMRIGIKRTCRTLEYREKKSKAQMGKNGPNWQGGITPINERRRKSLQVKLWKNLVFKRDDWICQKCKKRGKKLNAHHIRNFADYPKLRFIIDNGITFCKQCHQKFHKIYGFYKNNKKQINEFLK